MSIISAGLLPLHFSGALYSSPFATLPPPISLNVLNRGMDVSGESILHIGM